MKTVDFDIKYREKILNGTYTVSWNGQPVTIICWDRKGCYDEDGREYPVVALVHHTDDIDNVVYAAADGTCYILGVNRGLKLQVTYQDLPSKLIRVKYSLAKADSYVATLMGIYGYDRDNTEAKPWYDQKIDFINKYAKEHMNSLYLRLKESRHWEYDDAEDWEYLNSFKVGDLVICNKAFGAWVLNVDGIYTITRIEKDIFYVDAGLSFNKYDFVDTFTIHKQEEEKVEQPKATFDFSTLKTFEKVLVRHPHCPWHPAFFSLYRKECEKAPFCVVGENPYGSSYEQCVPFIGNEHLAHTIDPASAFYGFK